MVEEKEKVEKKVICTRIDGRLERNVKRYTEAYKISNSDLIREALVYYMKYAQKDDINTSNIDPMVIITKEDYRFLLGNLTDSQIEKIAENSYLFIIKGIEKYFEQEGYKETDISKITLKRMFPILKRHIFLHDSQNLLNSFDYTIQKEIVIVTGTHNLNLNFSKYFKQLSLKLLAPEKYNLVTEIIRENMINLTFEVL